MILEQVCSLRLQTTWEFELSFAFFWLKSFQGNALPESKACIRRNFGFSFHGCVLKAYTNSWLLQYLCFLNERSCDSIKSLVNWDMNKLGLRYVCLSSLLCSLLQILNSFESCLIPQLSSSPPDVEAMRIYLILPEFPLLQDSKYYISLTIPLAMAILRLDTNPSKVLGEFTKLHTNGFVLIYFVGLTTGSQWIEIQEFIDI